MSATPLMSEYPVEKKANNAYPVDESDVELVVGAPPARRCFWSRFRHRHHNGEARKRSPIRRAIRIFLAVFVVSSIGLFLYGRHFIRHQIKNHPITCVPITETTTTVELPLAHQFTRIGLHPSLTTGDAKIVHSEEVKEGTVIISFDMPEDTKLIDDEEDAKLYACNIAGPKIVTLGIHPKHHGEHHKRPDAGRGDHKHKPHGPRYKATSVTIKLPASEAGLPRGISFFSGRFPYGTRIHKFIVGCMKKKIKSAIAKAVRAAKAEKVVEAVEAHAE